MVDKCNICANNGQQQIYPGPCTGCCKENGVYLNFKSKTIEQLQKELDDANKKIRAYEIMIASAKCTSPNGHIWCDYAELGKEITGFDQYCCICDLKR